MRPLMRQAACWMQLVCRCSCRTTTCLTSLRPHRRTGQVLCACNPNQSLGNLAPALQSSSKQDWHCAVRPAA